MNSIFETFTELNKASVDEKKANEAVDIKKVIQDLIDTEASDDNEDQGKIVQLLRGLAFSDDPQSDKFMKRLTDMISDKNFGDLTEKKK
jgi:hypothetical protein